MGTLTIGPTAPPVQAQDLTGGGGTYQELLLDPKAIMGRTLAFLHPKGELFELCVIGPKSPKNNLWEGYASGKKAIVAGWFKDPEKAAKLAVQIKAEGVYVTLNPCQDALLARADHRLKANVNRTPDQYIQKIQNLLVDIDPQRPEGISSTDHEHEAALEIAQIIKADLTKEGWPEPLAGDSGNGAHLVYPIDLTCGDGSTGLLKAVLAGLARRFADHLARLNLELDQAVFNASRLTKLYGTMARKGDNTHERPHRLAQIVSLPKTRQVVPVELLRLLAATVPDQEKMQQPKAQRADDGQFDLEAYLRHYAVEVVKVKPHGAAVLYCLEKCIFDRSHSGNEAAIGKAADGTLFYQCFHDSCQGRTWAEARAIVSGNDSLLEFSGLPDWRGPAPRGAATCGACPKPNREVAAWPVMASEAFYGLGGEFVRLVEPHSEADPVALLVQILTGLGNVIGRGAWFQVEADTHHLKLNSCQVGKTAKARKGTSWGHVKSKLIQVDPIWQSRIKGGLSSGEGLIWAVRDPITKMEPVRDKGKATGEFEEVTVDAGVTDKRLLIFEGEFASVLRVIQREGNTLSAVARQAWDGGDLRTLTKNSPAVATGAHISVIGHITVDELKRYLDRTEIANGFGNRFLWLCVRRSKCLPEGGQVQKIDFAPLLRRLLQAVEFGKNAGEISRDPDAAAIWREVYPQLSEGKPGLVGALTARAEAQVMRLASIYAVLDQSRLIREEYLMAALAVWDYAESSVRYIFGEAIGDPVADTIFGALKAAPDGLTRTAINNLFGRHQSSARIQTAISELLRQGLITIETIETGGRPGEKVRVNMEA